MDYDLEDGDAFGVGLAALGDLDGDGVPDLAVGGRSGAIWILFLNDDATVADYEVISADDDAFEDEDILLTRFGVSLSAIGDLDDDGVMDLVVGAPGDDDGATNAGAVWILFLNDDGTLSDHQKISSTEGDFDVDLDSQDKFGYSVAGLGDLNDDGYLDIVVGASNDDDGDTAAGAVWVLFLDDAGMAVDYQKISMLEGGFDGELEEFDHFGTSVANVGDLDGDGITVLAVGARQNTSRFGDPGQCWILYLDEDGTVRRHRLITEDEGGFTGALDEGAASDSPDAFGGSVALVGDLDGDDLPELAVGAWYDEDGGADGDGRGPGAVWILFLGYPSLRGDVDGNGEVSVMTDALYLLNYVFSRGPGPECMDAADVDDNGEVSALLDALTLLIYGFADGPTPDDPGVEDCGPDPTADELRCQEETCE